MKLPLSYNLNTEPAPTTDLATVAVRDEDDKLICIVHVNATYGGSLEIIDFDRYSDHLGMIVKLAKTFKSAKCADLEAVQTVFDAVPK